MPHYYLIIWHRLLGSGVAAVSQSMQMELETRRITRRPPDPQKQRPKFWKLERREASRTKKMGKLEKHK